MSLPRSPGYDAPIRNQPPEPTGDWAPDGTQLPIEGEQEIVEEGDAGIGDAEIEYDEDPFVEGDKV